MSSVVYIPGIPWIEKIIVRDFIILSEYLDTKNNLLQLKGRNPTNQVD